MSISVPARSERRSHWQVAVRFGLVGALFVAVLITAFTWPAVTSSAKGLPVGISGPEYRITALTEVLDQQDPSPFGLVVVDSRNDAIDKIARRELNGAILLEGPEVLVASASGSAAAQALRVVATQLQSQMGATVQAALVAQLKGVGAGLPTTRPPADQSGAVEPPRVTVTDVVPLADSDPMGAGIVAVSFPLVLGGVLGGIMLSLLVAGAIRRLIGLAVFGVAAGALSTLILQTWFGMLPGNWLLNAAALGFGMTASAAFIIGMDVVLGRRGLGIAAGVTVLIANPISAAAIPLQFLPEPWGQIGQYFVPGAASNLLRSISYFPDAATAAQWTILLCWTALGVVLTLVGRHRDQPDMYVSTKQLDDQERHAVA
jgi:hypothetical protein